VEEEEQQQGKGHQWWMLCGGKCFFTIIEGTFHVRMRDTYDELGVILYFILFDRNDQQQHSHISLFLFSYCSSGVGWVDLVEEGGKPVNEQRLLVVTPQSFALMESPHCILVRLFASLSLPSSFVSSPRVPFYPFAKNER